MTKILNRAVAFGPNRHDPFYYLEKTLALFLSLFHPSDVSPINVFFAEVFLLVNNSLLV